MEPLTIARINVCQLNFLNNDPCDAVIDLLGSNPPFKKATDETHDKTKFRMVRYSRKVEVISPLNIPGDVNYQNEVIGVLFRQLHDKSDLYVVAPRDALRSLVKVMDPAFPQLVQRCFLEEKVLKVAYQGLVGNNLLSKTRYKEAQRVEPNLFFDKLILEVTACLKPNTSIFKLRAFKNDQGQRPRVTVSNETVRFHKKLQWETYPSLLNRLTKIYHKNMESNAHDEGPFQMRKYLKRASQDQVQPLNRVMHMVLWDAFRQGTPHRLFVSPRYQKDYENATSFRLFIKETLLCKWGSPVVTFSDMIQLLRRQMPNLLHATSKEFIEQLSCVNLAFTNKNGRIIKSPLLELFGGEVQPIEGGTFFLLQGDWYACNADYVGLIQTEFRKTLAECHIDLEDDRALKLPWPNSLSEGQYNCLYKNDSNMLVGDKALNGDYIELFDLLKIVKRNNSDEVVVYAVKDKFGQSMRDVASQIRISASLIHEVVSSGLKKPHWFDEYVATFVDIDKVGGKEKFVQSLERSKITFVCAIRDSSDRDIFDNCFKKDAIDASDLKELVQYLNLNPNDVANALIQNGFFTTEGRTTATFRNINQKNFSNIMKGTLKCTIGTAEALYGRLKKLIKPSINSFIAQHEFIALKQDLEAMGFVLKIQFVTHSVSEDEIVRGMNQLSLHPDQVLEFGNQQYTVKRAVNDTANALHAAFGILNSAEDMCFFYPGGPQVARDTLKRELESCLSNPLHPYYGKVSSRYLQAVRKLSYGLVYKSNKGNIFSLKLFSTEESLFKNLRDLEQKRKQSLESLIRTIGNACTDLRQKDANTFQKLVAFIEPDESLRSSDHFWQQLPYKIWQKIWEVVPVFTQDYSRYIQELNMVVRQFDKQIDAVLQMPVVQNAYLECICDGNYKFDSNEVCLASLAQKVGITILAQNGTGGFYEEDRELCEFATRHVLLRHNNEFLRCIRP